MHPLDALGPFLPTDGDPRPSAQVPVIDVRSAPVALVDAADTVASAGAAGLDAVFRAVIRIVVPLADGSPALRT